MAESPNKVLNRTNIGDSVEPNILIIRVSDACNAGCFMCQFAFSDDNYRFTVSDAELLAQTLRASSIRIVRFTGGEPLMLDELPKIVSIFAQVPVVTSIITNGFLLEKKARELIECGVGQFIVSIDGSSDNTHDKYRRMPGLFCALRKGVNRIKKISVRVKVRVNTVVGPHNVTDLLHIHKLLCDLGVDQWSILPLKRADRPWSAYDQEMIVDHLRALETAMVRNDGPTFLGYSGKWAGRTAEEISALMSGQKIMTPQPQCHLVDKVRYYTPKTGFVYPCNCIPHRSGAVKFGSPLDSESFTGAGLQSARNWLRQHGPANCRGCEPINAALGEGAIDIEHDVFGF